MKLKHLVFIFAAMPLGLIAQTGMNVSAVAPNFDDPEWQARFLGSYGFLSGAEPKVNQDEVELLQELMNLMKVSAGAATARLNEEMNEDSSAALMFVLANLYFQQSNLEEAEKYYAKAIEKFPDFRRAHKNLGLLSVQKQDYDKALKHLSRAVELGEHDGRNYGLMGYAYLSRENYLAAEEAYRDAIQQQPDSRDWKLGLAQALLAMERYPEVISLMDTMINEEPGNTTLWMLQSNAYLSQGEAEKAAVNLEMIRALGKAKRESLFLLGDIYFNQRNFDPALEAYQEAIDKDPQLSKFDNAIRAINLMLRAGAKEQAEALIQKLETAYPDQLSNDQSLELLTLQAKLARLRGDQEKAVEILLSIIERDGSRGDALIEIADYYADQGEIDRAIMHLEHARKLEAFEFDALVKHAQVLVKDKQYAEAAELLREALMIKEDPRIRRYLDKIESAIRA